MAGTSAREATPFFERPCPAMTKTMFQSETNTRPDMNLDRLIFGEHAKM
jgi:hypothetical protein